MTFALTDRAGAAPTNVVQYINFSLTFYEQGPTNQVGTNANVLRASVKQLRVTTKDIIAALGSATSNSFSGKARLVFVQNAGGTNAIEILDGTNALDVSAFFTTTEGLSVHSFAEFTGKTNSFAYGAKYGLLRLVMTNVPPAQLLASLHVGGFYTANFVTCSGSAASTGTDPVEEVDVQVAGRGTDVNGTPAVVQGDINVGGFDWDDWR